jgi:hypothetical protein
MNGKDTVYLKVSSERAGRLYPVLLGRHSARGILVGSFVKVNFGGEEFERV